MALGTALIVFVFIVFGIFSIVRFTQSSGLTPGLIGKLIFDDGIELAASSGRTNILILGIGGGNHEGADLTDTMIVLSLSASTKSAALVSIPRYIWSDTLKDKVNTAYHYGEEKRTSDGMILSRVVAEDVIGMPIHYAILIDFSGFQEMIDLIGGIDVNVSSAFTDSEYPIPGKEQDTCPPDDPTNRCVYETVHFDSGREHMDGARALIYVRSRHAEGEEGSDFARSRRQQDVLVAVKEKIMHPLTWVTPYRLSVMPEVLDRVIDTDMNIGELATVVRKYVKIQESAVSKIAFDNLLTTPAPYQYNGLYVLVPIEDWDTIHSYIGSQLNE